MNRIRTVWVVATGATERTILSYGVFLAAYFMAPGSEACHRVSFPKRCRMALPAYLVPVGPENMSILRRVRLVAGQALAFLHRGMDVILCKFRYPVAIVAQVGDLSGEQFRLVRLVRLVTVHAHPYINRAMSVSLQKLLFIMAFRAQLRHVRGQHFWCRRRMGVVTA